MNLRGEPERERARPLAGTGPKELWARQLSGYAAAHAAPLLAGVAGLVVLPRLLGTEAYGRYAVAVGVATVSAAILADWIVPTGLRLVPEAAGDAGQLWRVLGMMSAIAGLASGLLAGFLALPLGRALSLSAIALASASALARPFATWLRAAMRTGLYAAFSAASAGGSLALGALLYVATGSLPAILLGACVPALVGAAWYARVTGWPLHAPRQVGRWFNEALRFGLPIMVTGVGGQTLLLADRYILALLIGSDGAGRYAATYGASEKLVGLPFAVLFSAMYPVGAAAWAAGDRAQALDLVRATGRVFSVVAGSLGVFQAFSGPWLVGLLAGEAFRPPRMLPALVSFGTWFWFLGILQHQALEWEKRTLAITGLTLGAAGLNVAANLVLIPVMALVGAGTATTGAYAVYLAGVTFVVCRRKRGYRVWEVKPVLVAAGVALISGMSFPGSARPIAGCVAVVSYVLVTWILGAWRLEEFRGLLRHAVGRDRR